DHGGARQCYAKSKSLYEESNRSNPLEEAAWELAVGLVDLKEGQPETAKQRLAKMASLRPKITESNPLNTDLAEDLSLLLEGEILLAEGRVDEAIAVVGKRPDVSIPTLGSQTIFFYNFPGEWDVLARAFVAKNAFDEAIAEYERLVAPVPPRRDRRLVYPVFHYRLGRLYEEKGMIAKAVREYERFLEIMNGAGTGLAEAEDTSRRLDLLARIRP
ncbi:MAG: tetratricopeptide repeat protein, partial [Acidobacteriota bacterium]